MDLNREIATRLQARLGVHGRQVRCRLRADRLVLDGEVASFYHKQLAQEAVAKLREVGCVINRIRVVRPVSA